MVQRRSTKASDAIKSTLKTLFVIQNQTRWNSFYDAMARTENFIVHQNDGLRKVFQHFNMEYFTLSEKNFFVLSVVVSAEKLFFKTIQTNHQCNN